MRERRAQLAAILATRFLSGVGFQFFVVGGIDSLYRETSSALVTGLIGVVLFIPSLFAPLIAGRLLARVRQRGLLLVAIHAAVVLTSIMFLYAHEQPAWIVAAAFLFGALRAMRSPFLYSLLGELRDSGLTSARAARVMSLSWQLPLVVGPLMYSVGAARFPLILVVCNVLSLIAAIPFLFRKAASVTAPSFSLNHAVRTFLGDRDVAGPMLADAALNSLLSFATLLPFLLTSMAHPSSDIGLVRAVLNGASVAVAVLAPRSLFDETRSRTFYTSLLALTFVSIALAVTTAFPLMLALSAVFGAIDGWSILYRDALLMRLIGTGALASVSSIKEILISATDDLGEWRAGAMGEAFGARTGMLISAGVASCLGLFFLRWQAHGTGTQASHVAGARVLLTRRAAWLDQSRGPHSLDGDRPAVAHDEASRGALGRSPLRSFGTRLELDAGGPRGVRQR